ncbi:hypothetical protein CHS0354_020275 [Potamilus streckersoni]|uniref:Coadhesin n=1 Tax=Potamilus streckersoni TaxID=2493646 RepID=A0AAE0S5P8_9BIVA|nr:hypothetical protein CHS0354_020275 [Potamilus streckersoni]
MLVNIFIPYLFLEDPMPSHWSIWSSCTTTCGNGESVRHWICSNQIQIPLFGKGSTCTPHSERQTCSPGSCPIDGHWGRWSEWSMCPVTCGGHSQNRHRECNNPSPNNGGRQCEGSNMDNRQCPLSACHVDGHWSGWSKFSKCTVSCGLGTQMRSRLCSNPAPRNGGLDCLGSSMEAIICSFPACVPEPRVCDKIRLLSSISHNNSISQNGDTSCTDRSYHSSRALIQELCNAPFTSLHFGSQNIYNETLLYLSAIIISSINSYRNNDAHSSREPMGYCEL